LYRVGRAQPRLRRRGPGTGRDLIRRRGAPRRVARARKDARSEDPPLAECDVGRERENDHTARDRGGALHEGRQPPVEHRARAGGSGGSESLRDSDPQDQDRDRTDRDRDGVAGRDADEEGGAHYFVPAQARAAGRSGTAQRWLTTYAGVGSSCNAVENAQFLAKTLITVVASNNCSLVIPSWRSVSAR